ncbi:MAG TPA: MarR family transcriptional regulator [Algoriphagus sp.]|nr:MarR family transcriptional regulator [Algoriphagus sp.]
MLNEKKLELIERIGVFHERRGMQPLMGRILGLLLVLDEAEATFDEIIEYLNVSKSAVSNALNILQLQGHIAYKTKPGERKRYFYLTLDKWEEAMEKELCDISLISSFMKDVLKERGNVKPDFNHNIKDICNFMEFLRNRVPSLFKEFRKSQA